MVDSTNLRGESQQLTLVHGQLGYKEPRPQVDRLVSFVGSKICLQSHLVGA